MATGWAAMRFGWLAYVIPVLFVFSPALIMIGTPLAIGVAILTAGLGVWLISAALAGYFSGLLSTPMRILFGAAGLLALIPSDAFARAVYTDALGVALGLALMLYDVYTRRQEGLK